MVKHTPTSFYGVKRIQQVFMQARNIRYRYTGSFPIMYLVIMHLKSQGFVVISTSAFTNRNRYPRYVEELGKIRKGGFDIIIFDGQDRFIGVEVKPEFSYIEFKHALGQTITDLMFNAHLVDQAMIIMPHKNVAIEESLKGKFNHVLKNCGHPISVKYLPLRCRIV
jgi:hypothetical protein